ncbi:MAG TPA: 2Fe-2S iron-sulfur cluster-binding protein [Bryobacteraceae bacterium]|nr:2Fe-2S iron-sulfur cluster-binding protein [Bryobacteraceae bacterium]
MLLEGRTARSCITPMRATAGRQVTTIEGLERDGKLHSLQEAFLEEDALQCGYCTPGMIVAGLSLLRQNGNPSEQEVIHAMDGNVCRCGAYTRIVRAIQKAAVRMKGSAK